LRVSRGGCFPGGATVLCSVVAVAVVGCTATHAPAAHTQPPASAPSSVALSCAASAGQEAADPSAHPVNEVQSAALAGDTNGYDSLPAWKSSDGHRYLVWKAYLAVAPAGRPYRVVTVTSPGSARLFYASPAAWGAASGKPVLPPPPRSVRLPTCGSRYTGYTGGILVTRPACVTLTVTGPGSAARTVRVPVLIPRC
jgi:hypothetical protein